MLNLSVGDAPAELRAAVLAMKRADAEIRRDISARMRSTMNPVWRSEIPQHLRGSGRLEGVALTTGARIAAGNPPQLVTASSRRRYGSGGGIIPDRHWAGYEYGSSRDDTTTYRREHHSGTVHQVTRHTKRHLPGRIRRGRVIGPAVAAILPRIASYWTQSIVRAFMDAADRKG